MAKQPKKPRLLDAIKVMPRVQTKRHLCWYDRLRNRHPDLYSELREVVKDFNDGGSSLEVFRTVSALHRYLLDADEKRIGPKMLNGCGRVMFNRFVEFIRTNPNG